MNTLKFLGASGSVTGSSYLLSNDAGTNLLVDLGMFQGPDEETYLQNFSLHFDSSQLDGVVLTHAHLDHCGRLPLLSESFHGWIFMTEPTAQIIEIALYDAARIARENNHQKPLYTAKEVENILQRVRIVKYGERFEIGHYQIVMRDAGHILGSAILEIEDYTGEKIVFSGDLGNYPQDLLHKTEFIENAHHVVMESTYGDRVHPVEDTIGIIQSEINAVESNEGTLLIPAFSIDRTQVLLHILNHLKNEKKIDYKTPVFLDSPMGIRVTQVYKEFGHLFNSETQKEARKDDIFNFPGFMMVEEARASEQIQNHKGAKVIIAGNGMVSGGRIVRHVIDFMHLETSRLLIVGYQADGTYGKQLLEGAKLLEIQNTTVKIRGTVTEIKGLSAHADQTKLINWICAFKEPKTVFLVHGEDGAREVLKEKISQLIDAAIICPQLDESVPLKNT